jgi:hypothetical protein
LTGTTDNGVITLDGTAPNGRVESNLTFDGSTLTVTGTIQATGPVSASAFNIYTGGTPNLTSPTSLNIVATNGVNLSTSLSTTGFTTSTTFRETFSDLGSGSGASIDLSTANNFKRTFTGNGSISFSNAPAGKAFGFTLLTVNAGAHSLAWSGVNWVGGTPPILTSSGEDILVFYTFDGGSSYYGFVTGLNMN